MQIAKDTPSGHLRSIPAVNGSTGVGDTATGVGAVVTGVGAVVTGADAIGAAVIGRVTQLHLVLLYALAERARLVLVILFTATVLSLTGGGALAAEPVTVAVADFDYSDTSGEIKDQVDAHRARVVAFGQLLRDSFQSEGKYRVVGLDCPDGGCTAASMRSDDFLAHGRRSGARLVVYSGIRKMSTLVQWVEVQVLDLQRNELATAI